MMAAPCPLLLGLLLLLLAPASSCPTLAAYRLQLDTHWTRDDFPKHFPEWRPPAQWSTLVGRSHDASFVLFRLGSVASAGVKAFVEAGRVDAIPGAQGAGGVLDAFSAPAVATGAGRTTATFFVDGRHSKVSLMARIVPSPDWFVGLDSVDLCVQGHWVHSVTFEGHPLDAGTDNGLTFTSPRWSTQPQGPVHRMTSDYPPHPAGSFHYPLQPLPPIATFHITKVREYQLTQETNATAGGAMGGRHEPAVVAVGERHEPAVVAVGERHEPAVVAVGGQHEPAGGAVGGRHEPAGGAVDGRHEAAGGAVDGRHEAAGGAVGGRHEPAGGAVGGRHELAGGAVGGRHEPAGGKHEPSGDGGQDRPADGDRVTSLPPPPLAANHSGALLLPRGDKDAIVSSIVDKYRREGGGRGGGARTRGRHVKKHHRPPRDCHVTPWSAWGACSKSCGIGEMQRRRDVVRHARRGGAVCPPLRETKWCGSAQPCAKNYFQW